VFDYILHMLLSISRNHTYELGSGFSELLAARHTIKNIVSSGSSRKRIYVGAFQILPICPVVEPFEFLRGQTPAALLLEPLLELELMCWWVWGCAGVLSGRLKSHEIGRVHQWDLQLQSSLVIAIVLFDQLPTDKRFFFVDKRFSV
jgi:hypothetical protein